MLKGVLAIVKLIPLVDISCVLLMLSGCVSLNDYIINVLSTSLHCLWNKRKKRTKNPQAPHKSNKRKDENKLYEWDPRPENYRNVLSELYNEFVKDFQNHSGCNNELSMWETLNYFI